MDVGNGSQVAKREPGPVDAQEVERWEGDAPGSIPGSMLAPQLPVTQTLQEAQEFRLA